jgi:hypothetical protein
MSEEGLKMYLFLPKEKVSDAYIAVKQAHINDEIAEKTERVAGYGVIFTSKMNYVDVINKLNMKNNPFLLIELTGNVTTESISGFFPDTDIDELRSLNLESLKDNAEWLKKELDRAVDLEDFEKAAEIRDKINAKDKE